MVWSDTEKGYTEKKQDRTKKKWLRCKEATVRYGVSRPTIMNWATDSGALIKIDATVLIDSETIDRYIEGFRIPGGVYSGFALFATYTCT